MVVLPRINSETNQDYAKEPRWLAIIAMLATGLVYTALPSNLSVGPDWLLLAVMGVLVASTLISHRGRQNNWVYSEWDFDHSHDLVSRPACGRHPNARDRS